MLTKMFFIINVNRWSQCIANILKLKSNELCIEYSYDDVNKNLPNLEEFQCLILNHGGWLLKGHRSVKLNANLNWHSIHN